MGTEHEWLGKVARAAKIAVNSNRSEWFVKEFVPSLPEGQRRFALEKFDEQETRLATLNAMAGEKYAESRPYRRAGLIPIDVVLANVDGFVTVAGQQVSCQSWRIKLYAAKGVKCAHCGKEGTTFAAERAKGQQSLKRHLNLYHIADNGKETMITVDHIVPKSKGGGSHISNLQPLCIVCNGKKGNKMPDDEAA